MGPSPKLNPTLSICKGFALLTCEQALTDDSVEFETYTIEVQDPGKLLIICKESMEYIRIL